MSHNVERLSECQCFESQTMFHWTMHCTSSRNLFRLLFAWLKEIYDARHKKIIAQLYFYRSFSLLLSGWLKLSSKANSWQIFMSTSSSPCLVFRYALVSSQQKTKLAQKTISESFLKSNCDLCALRDTKLFFSLCSRRERKNLSESGDCEAKQKEEEEEVESYYTKKIPGEEEKLSGFYAVQGRALKWNIKEKFANKFVYSVGHWERPSRKFMTENFSN